MTTPTTCEMTSKTSFETLAPPPGMPKFPALDGWRGISILLVLAGHLFPLGPKRWDLNAPTASLGMVLFFTLSGFLITSTLLYRPNVRVFLIRRLCRIVPIAWLYTLIALAVVKAAWPAWPAQFLFYANLPPFWLTAHTGHLWSLCVEMQFYVALALGFAILGRRVLWGIPVLCLLVTAHRIETHTLVSIVTSLRVDEILAGGTLALICHGSGRFRKARRFLTWANPLLLLPLVAASCHPRFGALDYARPYLAAAMVGTTLLSSDTRFSRFLQTRWLAYVAAISYALYIFHPMVQCGWLETGTKIAIYAKRMPALVAVFGLAHLSTFYFEAYWIRLGKSWSKRYSRDLTKRSTAL
jgi:peptidoglycan/LPS O-acetylase OafA/YrhL